MITRIYGNALNNSLGTEEVPIARTKIPSASEIPKMTDDITYFITHWEAEAYRSKK